MRTWPALEVQRADSETSDLIQAFLLDFGVVAIDDTLSDSSRVFFQEAGERDRAAGALGLRFPHISTHAIDVPDEDWAARSQASLSAIRVGSIIVAPPWDVPSAGTRHRGAGIGDADSIVIVIQPSMGFGTGHHATTRLCLAALQQLDLRGRRVIDVGTGSGVLAIAASRLGATTVAAIDDDPDAIASARENLVLNPDARVSLRVVDLRSAARDLFDAVVANLTGGLLIAAADDLRSLADESGHLILSGFMVHEETGVRSAFSGCVLESRAQEDEWISVTLSPGPKGPGLQRGGWIDEPR